MHIRIEGRNTRGRAVELVRSSAELATSECILSSSSSSRSQRNWSVAPFDGADSAASATGRDGAIMSSSMSIVIAILLMYDVVHDSTHLVAVAIVVVLVAATAAAPQVVEVVCVFRNVKNIATTAGESAVLVGRHLFDYIISVGVPVVPW